MKHLKLFEAHSDDKFERGKRLLTTLGVYGRVYVVLVETVEAPYGESKDLIVFRALDNEEAKIVFRETLMKGQGGTSDDLEKTPYGDTLEDFIGSVLQDPYFTEMGATFAGQVMGIYDSSKSFENRSLPLVREEWTERKYIRNGMEELRKTEEFLSEILGASEAQRIMDKS